MGLKFLQKKKWHPLTIENLEAVWLAEQKEKEKRTLIKEHNKRIEEERKDEELKRAQVKAGLIPESDLLKMRWMYEVPTAAQDKPSGTMEDFFSTNNLQEQAEKEELERQEAKKTKERAMWWIMNNISELKAMVKEFHKTKDDSMLDNQFIKMIEKILEAKNERKRQKSGKHKRKDKSSKKSKKKKSKNKSKKSKRKHSSLSDSSVESDKEMAKKSRKRKRSESYEKITKEKHKRQRLDSDSED